MDTPKRADRPGAEAPAAGGNLDIAATLRALRRRADLSQRDLAVRSGVPPATVGAVEAGTTANPGFRTVERLVAATGARLAVVDIDGSAPAPLPTEGLRDAADRRLPPHLDPRWTVWLGARRVDRYRFIRNRRQRDRGRQAVAGELDDTTEYTLRRLVPADTAVLAALCSLAPTLDLAGRPGPAGPAPTGEPALRYLRDPAIRHWIATEWNSRRIVAHLVARVHARHDGRPILVVTDVGVRPEQRAGTVGGDLVAAVRHDATRLGVAAIHAAPDHPEVARYLCRLGFRPNLRAGSRGGSAYGLRLTLAG